MSLLRAKDQRDKLIEPKDARRGDMYKCPFCGVRVYRKMSSRNNPFFSCFPGEKHESLVCDYISKTNVTHSIHGLDPAKFFMKVLKEDAHNSSDNGSVPDDWKKHLAAGGALKPESETDDEEPAVTDIDPEAGIERPFSSLRQMWMEGLRITLQPDSLLGNATAVEFVIFNKWYKLCFETMGFTGGNRIIQARPQFEEIYREKTIKFACFWIENEIWKRVFLLLKFQYKKDYDEIFSRLFEKKEKNGILKWQSKHDWVLIAGHWEVAPVNSDRNGYFQCKFVNKHQLFVCPDNSKTLN